MVLISPKDGRRPATASMVIGHRFFVGGSLVRLCSVSYYDESYSKDRPLSSTFCKLLLLVVCSPFSSCCPIFACGLEDFPDFLADWCSDHCCTHVSIASSVCRCSLFETSWQLNASP